MVDLRVVLDEAGVAQAGALGEAGDDAAGDGHVFHVRDEGAAVVALLRLVGAAGVAEGVDAVADGDVRIIREQRERHAALRRLARAQHGVVRVHAGGGVEHRAGDGLTGVEPGHGVPGHVVFEYPDAHRRGVHSGAALGVIEALHDVCVGHEDVRGLARLAHAEGGAGGVIDLAGGEVGQQREYAHHAGARVGSYPPAVRAAAGERQSKHQQGQKQAHKSLFHHFPP